MKNKIEIEKIYSLTPMQEGMLFHSLMDKDPKVYFIQGIYTLKGEIDIANFEKSFDFLVKRYESLRTVFVFEKISKPKQIVLKNVDAKIRNEDISHLPENEKKVWLEEFVIKDREKGFDLTGELLQRVSLIKTGEALYKLVWSNHHIILDGWGRGIIIKEFFQIYQSFREGKPLRLEPITPYNNYIKWLEKQDVEAGLKYWQEYLDGYENQTTLPRFTYPGESNEYQYNLQEHRIRIGKALIERLEEVAKEYQVTINTIFQTIWGLLMMKYNNTTDVVFGAVSSGRPPQVEGIESMIGLFVNTIPVRIKLDDDIKYFSQLMENVQQKEVLSKSYDFLPLVEIQANSPVKRNLIDHIFVFENYPIHEKMNDAKNEKDVDIEVVDSESFVQTNFDFELCIIPGRDIEILIRFNSLVYEGNFIKRIGLHIEKVLEDISRDPGISLAEIEIIPEEQKKAILIQFNCELMAEPKDLPFQLKLFESFQKHSNNISIVNGEKEITYNELERRSNFIANWIYCKGIKKETFIGIILDDRSEFIVSMVGIVKAGCVFVPLDSRYPKKRLEEIIESTDIHFIISSKTNLDSFAGSEFIKKPGIEFFVPGDLWVDEKPSWFAKRPNLRYSTEDKIYIYFTSGTTGKPRAIVGKNESLLQFISWEIDTFGVDETFKFSQFITPIFDVFLRDIWVPLCTGSRICIPENNMMGQIIQWIDKREINLIHCVPSLFRLFNTSELTPKHFKHLKYVSLSGEKINPTELKNWFDTFDERIQLVNIYGPTETTLAKAFHFIKKSDLQRIRIPIGKTIAGAQIIILDRNMRVCDLGIIGEIYIRTPYSSFGYYNAPQWNKERFIRNPFNNDPKDLIYKSGDFGRRLFDGNIEFMGRMDRQVKVRGIRVELEEIERVFLNHEAIDQVVIIEREDTSRDKYLCAYFVPGKEIDIADLREYLAEELPYYMIPSYFVRLEELPLRPSGKVDTKKLPAVEVEVKKNDHIPPGDDTEKKLAALWMEVLDVEKEDISIDNNFFEMGGHSLKAIRLISRIHKEFNVKFQVTDMFKIPTIRGLAKYITGAARERYTGIEAVEEKEYYPLTPSQKRLYILQQMETGNKSYNITGVFLLEGEVDIKRMRNTFKKLIKRHTSFRTSFELIGDEPVQKIHKEGEVEFEIENYDLTDPPEGTPGTGDAVQDLEFIIHDVFIRPFDLSQVPLVRAGLIRMEERKHILMVDIHHIISDATSMRILIKEFSTLYKGGELSRLRLQFKDYAEWTNSEVEKAKIKRQEEHWLMEFKDEVPVLNLPNDYARPDLHSFEGNHIVFEVDSQDTRTLNHLARKENATLFMVLLALYNVLLSKLSGQKDIVVGSPIAGRRHSDLEYIVGMFVNTLTLRNFPTQQKTFLVFLREVRGRVLETFANQDIQFEELVEKVVPHRDMSRNPLFDVMFMLQNVETPSGDGPETGAPDLKVQPFQCGKKTSKFDLTLICSEEENKLFFIVEYCTKLFKQETIDWFIRYFKEIVSSILKNPHQKLAELEITSYEMRQEMQEHLYLDLENE